MLRGLICYHSCQHHRTKGLLRQCEGVTFNTMKLAGNTRFCAPLENAMVYEQSAQFIHAAMSQWLNYLATYKIHRLSLLITNTLHANNSFMALA